MPCTTILAGRSATANGATLISRNDDGGFTRKAVRVMDPKKQPRKYCSKIAHCTIELPEAPLSYTYCDNVDHSEGIWPASGINSENVGMTATETITSNPRVYAADPYVKYEPRKGKKKEVPGGIGEEDLVLLVLPYIRSAREGVLRLGSLLEKYGTYEANGIAFQDVSEIWWLETIGGHHWIAKRVPDDRVVIMPNQFGMDEFDFEDAFGAQKEHLCSPDLLDFVRENHLYTGQAEDHFNPRLAFGSRDDSDHIYNTPRAWYMARYFLDDLKRFDGDGAEYTPESNDIPWSLVPSRKVTPEDIHYLLGSHYQGTPYDPYDSRSPLHGKYRTIGVPNSDVSIILELRPDLPKELRGIEWITMGGSSFTAACPFYTSVTKMPAYLSGTTETVNTAHLYWHSRLLAALTDAHFGSAVIHTERYQKRVMNQGRKLVLEYDRRFLEKNDPALLAEANEKLAEMFRKESDDVIKNVLLNASEHMKVRYHRGDN